MRQLLSKLDISAPIIEKSFVYSLTKFVDKHRLNFLFNKACIESDNYIQLFLNKIIKLLKAVYIVIKDIHREKIKKKAIFNLLFIFNHASFVKINSPINSEWNYRVIADCVYKRLFELNSLKANIFIDNEQKTYDSIKRNGLNVFQADSKDSSGIRIDDMFVGFVGKFVRALKNDISEPEIKSLSDIKKILCKKGYLVKSGLILMRQPLIYKRN